MKLVYTATAYPPSTGGAQLHTHRLAMELSSRPPTLAACAALCGRETEHRLVHLTPRDLGRFQLDRVSPKTMGTSRLTVVRIPLVKYVSACRSQAVAASESRRA